MAATKTSIGECEFCSKDNVELTLQHGDLMCSDCIERESVAILASQKASEAEKFVSDSRIKDSQITLKSDIMQATTVSFIELQGAIENNPAIPAEQKQYALVEETIARIQRLDSVIFTQKTALADSENERMVLLKHTQQLVATLRADKQAKFAQYSVNYRPKPVTTKAIKGKSTKAPSARPITPSSKYTHKDLVEACERFKADMSMVKMKLLSPSGKDMSPMDAARFVAERN